MDAILPAGMQLSWGQGMVFILLNMAPKRLIQLPGTGYVLRSCWASRFFFMPPQRCLPIIGEEGAQM